MLDVSVELLDSISTDSLLTVSRAMKLGPGLGLGAPSMEAPFAK